MLGLLAAATWCAAPACGNSEQGPAGAAGGIAGVAGRGGGGGTGGGLGDAAMDVGASGGSGGAAGTGTGGTRIDAGAPKNCVVDSDCTLGLHQDQCCSDCWDAYSKAYATADPCLIVPGEPVPSTCSPSNCTACPPSTCLQIAGAFCKNETCTAASGPGGYDCTAMRAFCPPEPPLDGSDCCNAPSGSMCRTTCVASTFACDYDRCLLGLGSDKLTARCTQGKWVLESQMCPACPISCAPGEICVVFSDGLNTIPECKPSPCGPGPVDCICDQTLCTPRNGSCDEGSSGGSVLSCLIPSGGP
ncbi:MAG TPA: hypothetical protein VGJ84_23800 [Polyangiaceae bacterium]